MHELVVRSERDVAPEHLAEIRRHRLLLVVRVALDRVVTLGQTADVVRRTGVSTTDRRVALVRHRIPAVELILEVVACAALRGELRRVRGVECGRALGGAPEAAQTELVRDRELTDALGEAAGRPTLHAAPGR